jgi:hypothetical protein
MAFNRLRRGGSAGLLALVRCELAPRPPAVVWILVCAPLAQVGVVDTAHVAEHGPVPWGDGLGQGGQEESSRQPGQHAKQHCVSAKHRRILLAAHRRRSGSGAPVVRHLLSQLVPRTVPLQRWSHVSSTCLEFS